MYTFREIAAILTFFKDFAWNSILITFKLEIFMLLYLHREMSDFWVFLIKCCFDLIFAPNFFTRNQFSKQYEWFSSITYWKQLIAPIALSACASNRFQLKLQQP